MPILAHRNNLPCRQAQLLKKTVRHHHLRVAGRVLEALLVIEVPHRVVGLHRREGLTTLLLLLIPQLFWVFSASAFVLKNGI